jgi:hypothetical protein
MAQTGRFGPQTSHPPQATQRGEVSSEYLAYPQSDNGSPHRRIVKCNNELGNKVKGKSPWEHVLNNMQGRVGEIHGDPNAKMTIQDPIDKATIGGEAPMDPK